MSSAKARGLSNPLPSISTASHKREQNPRFGWWRSSRAHNKTHPEPIRRDGRVGPPPAEAVKPEARRPDKHIPGWPHHAAFPHRRCALAVPGTRPLLAASFRTSVKAPPCDAMRQPGERQQQKGKEMKARKQEPSMLPSTSAIPKRSREEDGRDAPTHLANAVSLCSNLPIHMRFLPCRLPDPLCPHAALLGHAVHGSSPQQANEGKGKPALPALPARVGLVQPKLSAGPRCSRASDWPTSRPAFTRNTEATFQLVRGNFRKKKTRSLLSADKTPRSPPIRNQSCRGPAEGSKLGSPRPRDTLSVTLPAPVCSTWYVVCMTAKCSVCSGAYVNLAAAGAFISRRQPGKLGGREQSPSRYCVDPSVT